MRTKRAFDRLEEGCVQIQEFGEVTNRSGIVLVQYMDNKYIKEDKEFMRNELIRIILNYPKVKGAGFTYEIYDLKRVKTNLKFWGFLKKDLSELTNKMVEATMFQNPTDLGSLERKLLNGVKSRD